MRIPTTRRYRLLLKKSDLEQKRKAHADAEAARVRAKARR